ncbi:hypothetical protein OIU77_019027 [Salix suchowensis]|uniref:Uncharacterized protein n=1 Tax=Salix suchowensis TaxID=1278906 RepID=A0ABQ9CEG7_9ROSI|nr:hypothetical protein OIU77_019027 [Salix suchowensis]
MNKKMLRFPSISPFKSMPVLVSQWMEGSSHLSPENAAAAFPHTAERLIQPSMFGFFHQEPVVKFICLTLVATIHH